MPQVGTDFLHEMPFSRVYKEPGDAYFVWISQYVTRSKMAKVELSGCRAATDIVTTDLGGSYIATAGTSFTVDWPNDSVCLQVSTDGTVGTDLWTPEQSPPAG